MNRQALLVLATVLFLLSLASAKDNVIYNKTYTEGNTISILGVNYVVGVSIGNATSVRFSNDDSFFIVGEDSCEIMEYQMICHDEKLSDTAARLILFDLRPVIKLTIRANQTDDLFVGDIIEVISWVNNTGMRDADDVIVTSSIPKNMTLLNVRYCSHNATHVLFDGPVTVDQGLECIYELRMDDRTDGPVRSQAHYLRFGEKNITYGASKDIETDMPFVLNITHDDLSVMSPGEEFSITLTIYNQEDDNLTLSSIYVNYGRDVIVKSVSSPKATIRSDDVKITRQVVESDDVLPITVQMSVPMSNVSGEIEFVISYNYSDSTRTRTFKKYVSYGTGSTDVDVWMEPLTPSFESLSTGNVSLFIRNTNPYLSLKGYDIKVTSDLLKKPYLVSLPYLTSRKITNLEFDVPSVTESQTFPLTVSVVARTVENELITKDEQFFIDVVPFTDIVVKKVLKDEGDEQRVTLSVTNTHPSSITVDLSEQIPAGIFVSGITSVSLDLAPAEEKEAYSFTFLKGTNTDKTVEFVTLFEYDYQGSTISGSRNLDVRLDAVDAASNTTPIQNSSVVTPTNTSLSVNEGNLSQDGINATDQQSDDSLLARASSFFSNISQFTLIMVIGVIILGVGILVLFNMKKKSSRSNSGKEKSAKKDDDSQSGKTGDEHDMPKASTTEHQAIHKELLEEKEAIHKQKMQLAQEYRTITAKIHHVQTYLQQYSQAMPVEFGKLEDQRRHIKEIELEVQKKTQDIISREKALADEQKKISEYSSRLGTIEKDIDVKEQKLNADKQKLESDVLLLKEEQGKLKGLEQQLVEKEASLKKRMADFKLHQVKQYKTKLSDLSAKKSEFHKSEERILEEERKIEVEFAKVKEDLHISEDDLALAEKIYKEAETELQKKRYEK